MEVAGFAPCFTSETLSDFRKEERSKKEYENVRVEDCSSHLPAAEVARVLLVWITLSHWKDGWV